jgi:hypothetical protein
VRVGLQIRCAATLECQLPEVDSDQSMVLTVLEVIGFIATRPTDLCTNALFVQRICHI